MRRAERSLDDRLFASRILQPLAVVLLLAGAPLLAGCGEEEEKGAAEQLGKQLDETLGKAGEAMKEAAEEAGAAMEEAGEALKDAAEEASEAVKEGTE